MRLAQTQFRGTQRFELVVMLGRGANGAVFEAIDRETGASVALKVLLGHNAAAIAHFKNEFRALQGIRHPNLVELLELIFDNSHWLLSMELVRGIDIVAYARGAEPAALFSDHETGLSGDQTLRERQARRVPAPRPPGEVALFDEERLRSAFLQLARGLAALHEAHKVHRDVKPSNVLVAKDGRVVVLDFGLVADLDDQGFVKQSRIAGTPSYMSPEQAAIEPVGPPSDWFSVGVTLYQALTGVHPFAGRADGGSSNEWEPPPPPIARCPRVPGDLNALCVELLAPDPAARPDGPSVLRRLGAKVDVRERNLGKRLFASEAPFVGRASELGVLHDSLNRVRDGQALTVVIEGESGVGKTSLIRRFLEEVGSKGDRVACFGGRCFERESLPYKAVDGVVDRIGAHLAELEQHEIGEILPPNARIILRAFPVLHRVVPFAAEPALPAETDSHAERLRIFAALREVLVRLARRRLTIVTIDDMQWADVDSLALLAAMMRPPSAPPILLVLARRPGSPLSDVPLRGDTRRLSLRGLSPGESDLLLTTLLQATFAGTTPAQASLVMREAGGHPLFLQELARRILNAETPYVAGAERLDDVLWQRMDTLAAPTRRMIELVAVAGTPVPQRTIADAWRAARLELEPDLDEQDAGFGSAAVHMAELRHACLIRTAGPHPNDAIEPYHDRIREAALARLEPGVRKHHHRLLAEAIERTEAPDSDALCYHWLEAGNAERALTHAESAAHGAARALAFERAARLYRLSLTLLPATDSARRRTLTVRLAESLANAGRGREAAQAYQDAARSGQSLDDWPLLRLAAEQLLRSGHVDEGVELVSRVLRELGVHVPQSRPMTLLSLGMQRARIRLRGFGYRIRDDGEISAVDSARIDATWTAATCLTVFDSVRSSELQCRSTLLSLEGGTALQVLRAHSAEALFLGLAGNSQRARIRRLLAAASDIASQLGHEHARAWVALTRGVSAFFLADWAEGEQQCRAAEEVFERRPGALFELTSARSYGIWSAMMRGELGQVLRRAPRYVQEAEDRGDLFSATYLMTGFSNLAWLCLDDVAEARRMLALAESRTRRASFDVTMYLNMFAAVMIELYAGDGTLAYRRALRDWMPLRWGVAFRAQITRVGMRWARGLAALAAFDESGDRGLVRDADACGRRIQAEGAEWACLAHILFAGVCARRDGDGERTVRHLESAEGAATASGMALHRAVTRYRRGELLGGDAGRQLKEQGLSFMTQQEVKQAEPMLNVLSPHCSPRSEKQRGRRFRI